MASDKKKMVMINRNNRLRSILECLLFLFYSNNRSQKHCFRYFAWYEHKYKGAEDIPPGISLIKSFGRRTTGPLKFMVASSETDGFIYTGCDSHIVWTWNKMKAVRGFRYGSITAVVASAQGHIILSNSDGTIAVWKRNDTEGKSTKTPSYMYNQVITLPTQVGRITDMLGRMNKYLWSYKRYEYPISCLCLSEDKMFLYSASFDSGSMDHAVKVWRLRDWRLVETIQGSKDFPNNTGKVTAMTTGLGDLMFYSSNQSTDHGTVRMFQRVEGKRKDIPKHKFVSVLLSERLPVRALLCNSTKDGTCQLYAGLEDGTLRFWHQKTGWKNPMTLSYHTRAVTCIAGLSTSLVFSSSLDGKICAWSTTAQYNDKPLMVLTPHQGRPVCCLAVREDWEENDDGCRRLILYSSGQEGTIKIWRISPEDIKINAT